MRAAAKVLVNTQVQMAIIPTGTGNLLARNLALPINDVQACTYIAFNGQVRPIDVISLDMVHEDGSRHAYVSTVIAGAGFDAEIMHSTSDRLKAAAGWLAYTEAGMRKLRGKRYPVAVTTADGGKTAQAQEFIKAAMGVDVVFNHADYRLISSRVLREFANFKEVNLYLRGMVPLVGFKSTSVYYARAERLAGESKYPLKKMLALAFEGVTSLSTKPLKMITGLGLAFTFLSLFVSFILLLVLLFGGSIGSAAWIALLILFLSSVQISCIGLVGSYIGKTYLEVKARPRYIISERTEEKN